MSVDIKDKNIVHYSTYK